MTDRKWWNDRVPDLMARSNHELNAIDVLPVLFEKAMDENLFVYGRENDYESFRVKDDVTEEQLLARLNEIGPRLVFAMQDRNHGTARSWADKDSFFSLTMKWYPKEGLKVSEVTCMTVNPDVYLKLEALLAEVKLIIPTDKGYVYTLRHTPDGFELTPFGAAGNPLIRDNYSPEVLARYDHAVSDLKKADPCGRLIIMSGPPGCGKTWMIRAMLTEVPRARFALITPSLIPNLGDPSLLPDLKSAVGMFDGPMILLLEDADACLVPRMNDNIMAVQNLLNASDGIIGSTLDIRIVATTNSRAMEIDKALTRPGRMCTQMEVGPLPAAQANKVFQRLTESQDAPFAKSASLAEIYLRTKRPDVDPTSMISDKHLGL